MPRSWAPARGAFPRISQAGIRRSTRTEPGCWNLWDFRFLPPRRPARRAARLAPRLFLYRGKAQPRRHSGPARMDDPRGANPRAV